MALTADDHVDIGTLIGFAVQPTARPGNKPEYRRVLSLDPPMGPWWVVSA